MSNLRLGTYIDTDVYYADPLSVYALIFNSDNNAIKESVGIYSFDEYLLVNHSDYCIDLLEHSNRTRYFFADIDTSSLVMPSTSNGSLYCIEYWMKSSESEYSRENDFFLSHEMFMWDSVYKRRYYGEISIEQEKRLVYAKANVSAAYDSIEGKVRIIGWLEIAGRIIETTKRLDVYWNSFDDTEIASAQKTVHQSNTPGVFAIEISGIDLNPDLVTPIKAVIVDEDDIEYGSVVSAATYD